MSTKHLIVFLLNFVAIIGWTQKNSLEILGVLSEVNEPTIVIQNADIIAIKTGDTLQRTKTKSDGSYNLQLELAANEQLILIVKHRYYIPQSVDFAMTSNRSNVQLNIELSPILVNYENTAFFEQDSSSTFYGFDVELLKHQLRTLDDYCLTFSYVHYTDESPNIAKRRIKAFKQHLNRHGINTDHFIFNDPIQLTLDNSDKRSRIEGIMHSIDKNCKDCKTRKSCKKKS